MEPDVGEAVRVSSGGANHEKAFLSSDLLSEILSRVDARTLARASCVSSEFRRVCEGEEFWERQCGSRWPSTHQAAAKELITQTGGFRKFYAQCRPSLAGGGGGEENHHHDTATTTITTTPSPADFVSIIDIVYNGQPMLSRIVTGFPGSEHPSPGWFEYCPFQFDLLEAHDDIIVNGIRKGPTTVAIQTDVAPVTPAEERKMGRLWTALNANLTASWILINKATGDMANLATSKPVGGLRHWPCDHDFVLHFGTVVPSVPSSTTLCSVAVKARICASKMSETESSVRSKTETATTMMISVTEVGMKMEDEDGGRLYGLESVAVLDRALRCRSRTAAHDRVSQAYREFGASQAVRKAERVQEENRRELMAALVSGVGAFLCLCYILL